MAAREIFLICHLIELQSYRTILYVAFVLAPPVEERDLRWCRYVQHRAIRWHAVFENMPSFVPVLFEMTVYFAAHLMVITFYLRSKLWPFKKPENPVSSTTDDKFLIEIHSNGEDKRIKALLKKTGALEIKMYEKEE